jgi:hypothetical protein
VLVADRAATPAASHNLKNIYDGGFVAGNTQTIGAGVGQRDGWTVTYNSARDGQYSSITVLCTANHGSSANVGFTAALLQ